MLKESFPAVAGFEDTLFQQRPQLRSRQHPTAANIYYRGTSEHYVATVYVAPNKVVFMDSLNPGNKPCEPIVKQIKDSYNLAPPAFTIESIFVQKQTGVDCGAFSIANLWCFLQGMKLSTTSFCEDAIRAELYKSFKQRKLHFRSSRCKHRHASISYRIKLV